MPSIYLDQSALIDAYERTRSDDAFRKRFVEGTAKDRYGFILSAWHWVEAARTRDLEKATRLADFMDSLRPGWLRDRRDLERIEVEERFYKFLGLEYLRPSAVVSRAELIAALNGLPLSAVTGLSSRDFVEGWIKKPELMQSIERSQRQNAEALRNVRAAEAVGRLTRAIVDEGDRGLIKGFLPQRTPTGLLLDEGTKSQFLETVTIVDFPTLAIEAAISQYGWSSQGRTDWNSMVDRIHMISALPYVDLVVSDDKYFGRLFSVSESTPSVHAQLIRFCDFCKRFVES